MAERSIALEPVPINTAPRSEYASSNRTWQGIPGIERSPDGRLWAVWYSGGKGEDHENYVVLVTSDDDGDTWSSPRFVVDPPDHVRAFDSCLWHDPTNRLWWFWAQSYNKYDGRAGVWCTRCDEPSADVPVWTPPGRIADGVMMNRPIALSTGDWLLPVAVWQYEPTPPAPVPPRTAIAECDVLCSEDEGETFALRGGADMPSGQSYEHMVVERRDGALWMLMRTADGVGESISTDRGRTWSPGKDKGLGGPDSRFHIQRLRSGNLLLVNHDDSLPLPDADPPTKRSNLTAWLSDDDGATWQGGLLIDGRPHVSYPDAVQAEDGRIYIIYDRERGGAKEILLAVFREDDVLAGECVSPDSRLRVLVDKVG